MSGASSDCPLMRASAQLFQVKRYIRIRSDASMLMHQSPGLCSGAAIHSDFDQGAVKATTRIIRMSCGARKKSTRAARGSGMKWEEHRQGTREAINMDFQVSSIEGRSTKYDT